MTKLALNPFKKGKKTEVEGVRKVDVERDSELEKTLEQYNSIEEGNWNYEDLFSELDKIILTPQKIDLFLQYVINNDLIKQSQYRKSGLTGKYISKLIQDSHNEGYNRFILNSRDTLIDCLASNLKAKEDKLIVRVNGSLGEWSCNESRKLFVSVYGDVGRGCGTDSMSSGIYITGNSKGGHCAVNLITSFIEIHGDIEDHGFYGSDSHHTVHRTSNQDTYKKMIECVGETNEIHLIDKNREILEKYND